MDETDECMDKILQASGFEGERSIVLPGPIVSDLSRSGLTSSLYLASIGRYPKARYHFRERGRGAAENILIYCVGGSGWYELDGNRHDAGKDQFFVLPEGVAHRYAADLDDPWTIYWVHFSGEKADELAVLRDA
jgi:AraC family transcriptional regulator of arabinose operon